MFCTSLKKISLITIPPLSESVQKPSISPESPMGHMDGTGTDVRNTKNMFLFVLNITVRTRYISWLQGHVSRSKMFLFLLEISEFFQVNCGQHNSEHVENLVTNADYRSAREHQLWRVIYRQAFFIRHTGSKRSSLSSGGNGVKRAWRERHE